jgi:hypothetical protein
MIVIHKGKIKSYMSLQAMNCRSKIKIPISKKKIKKMEIQTTKKPYPIKWVGKLWTLNNLKLLNYLVACKEAPDLVSGSNKK